MKFQINAKAFAAALAASTKLVPRKHRAPVLEHVKITARTASIAIGATDLDAFQTVTLPADVEAQGAALFPAHALHAMIKGLPGEATVSIETVETEIDYFSAATRKEDGKPVPKFYNVKGESSWRWTGPFEADCCDWRTREIAAEEYCALAGLEGDSRGVIKISAGGARLSLPYGVLADFPAFIEAPEDAAAFEVAPAALADLLERTAFAISTEKTRYYLNGVYMHLSSEGLFRLVATDGHRLGLAEMPAPAITGNLPGVIVPRLAVDFLRRLLKKVTAPVAVRVGVNYSSWTITAKDGTEIVLETKHVDGTFPDYMRVIPSSNDRVATLEKAAFAAAVKRVGRGAKVNHYSSAGAIKLSFERGELKLSRNLEGATASETMPCDFEGDSLEIGFNPAYLATSIEASNGEMVRLEMADAGAPVLFAAREGASVRSVLVRSVLVPMRV